MTAIHGHKARIFFDGFSPTMSLSCQAPHDAPCKAEWDCDCETFFDFRVTDDGLPTHLPNPHDPHLWHTGRWGTECALADWFENDDEPLTGTVEVDVTATWEGDFYAFQIAEVES